MFGSTRKLADISMKWKKDRLEAQVVRDGVTLIKTGCTLDDEGAWIDSGPNINLKMIPNVTGKGYDIAVLNAAYLVYDIKNGRSGEVEIEFNNGPNDIFEGVSIESTMIGLYFDTDITVPEGNKIAKFKV